MNIVLNGEERDCQEGESLLLLLRALDLEGQRLAVEVNEELVPRSRFADYRLVAGDQVEIVRAIGGG